MLNAVVNLIFVILIFVMLIDIIIARKRSNYID